MTSEPHDADRARHPQRSEEPEGSETAEASESQQDDVARRSRQTGGDAPAAGSIEEREAVAADRDELFEDEESRG